MLSKCANPGCPQQFHSLRQGRLFVLETTPRSPLKAAQTRHKPERLEYFWLCNRCCKSKRVIADVNRRIVVASTESDNDGIVVSDISNNSNH